MFILFIYIIYIVPSSNAGLEEPNALSGDQVHGSIRHVYMFEIGEINCQFPSDDFCRAVFFLLLCAVNSIMLPCPPHSHTLISPVTNKGSYYL